MSDTEITPKVKMVVQPDVLVVLYFHVAGENDDLLGTDETPIVKMLWTAIDVPTNEVIGEGEYELEYPDVDENNNITENEKEEDHSDMSEDIEDNEQEMTDDFDRGEIQHSVESIALKQALAQFDEIITELSQDSQIVRIVTENQLHLRQCLHPRAFKLDLQLADHFYSFYDIRKEYRKYTMSTTPFRTLKDIADDMSVEDIEDQVTSPEDACNFCATVTQHLLKEGHKFSTPEYINKCHDAGITSGYVKDDTIIRARGLPWQVSDCDVADFFVGLNICRGGVALCLNLKGRRNGEALVRVESSEHRDMALKRHKHHLFGRYIEVYKGAAQEFLKIAKGPAGAMTTAANFLANGGDVLIRMRGLPFDATAENIVTFFGASPKVQHGEEGVLIVLHPDGSSTGDAFVLFETEQEGQLALKKHRENIGKRYVELFRSTRAELQQVLTMYNVGIPIMNPSNTMGTVFPSTIPTIMSDRALINQRLQALMNMSCLRLRGLPFSASKEDILTFLDTHASHIIGTVHIIYNLQGRPSGEAVVQLQNPEQAHKCSSDLHLKHMGERYIEVFQCCVQDMTWMLATSHANQLAAQHMNNHHNNNNFRHNISPPPAPPATTTQAPITALPSPPPITTGFIPQPMPAMQPVYTGQYPVVSPIPGGFIPHHQPALPPMMINPEALHHPYPINQFGKPGVAYITFAPPETIMQEKHFQPSNRYVEMFVPVQN